METAIVLAAGMFPALPITMAAFLLLIQAAAAAQAAKATRANGLAALRDTKVEALWTAMKAIKTYVEGLASGMDATSAASLIQAAGLLVADTTTRTQPRRPGAPGGDLPVPRARHRRQGPRRADPGRERDDSLSGSPPALAPEDRALTPAHPVCRSTAARVALEWG